MSKFDRRVRGLTVVAVLAGTVVACGSESSDTTATTATVGTSPATVVDTAADTTEVPPVTESASTLSPTAQRMADIAITDLATRLDASADITVVSVEEVNWRNGSLGCPAKGMQYTQVVTPGTRIVLTHDGLTYEYHAGSGRDPFYCATPEAPLAN
jgi:hypothetical protein